MVDSQENLDPVAEARNALENLVADRRRIDMESYYHQRVWMTDRVDTEIGLYGDNSVVHLIPQVRQLYGSLLSRLLASEIHTKEQLGKIDDETIANMYRVKRLQDIRHNLGIRVLLGMRDLAKAELAYKKEQ